jgi:TonB family protein
MAQGSGNGSGGSLPRGPLDGTSLAGRARELMRGIDLPGAPPAALRPAQQMPDRRRRVVDTLERDVPLRLYVDSFRQKIERNAAQIRMQLAGGPGRSDPVVSVAVRSDGSVDDVTIVRSSGRADLDDAVRRIVHLNARYAAFPPNVAARFDVIEIRRIWLFAESLKLLEEVR